MLRYCNKLKTVMDLQVISSTTNSPPPPPTPIHIKEFARYSYKILLQYEFNSKSYNS